MQKNTSELQIDVEEPVLTRRLLMKLAGASTVVGGFSFASGVAGAQTIDDLCELAQLDVVVVLDQSGSMSLGSPTRMQLAKAGATALVNALNVSPSGVHVGVVTFGGAPGSSDIPLFQPLTGNAATALGAISSIPDIPAGNILTNMEAGVQAGREELTGMDYSDDIAASGTNRTDVPRVMVLLGDGAPNVDNNGIDDPATFPSLGGSDPSEEANAAKTVDDIEVYTIGVGLNSLAQNLMLEMASEPKASHAFPNVDVEQIEATFEEIAADICPTEVEIDIKPGSYPNAINCSPNREAVIPVAILTTGDFDATTVDPASLRFGSPSTVIGGGGATLVHGDGHLQDVDLDGDRDFLGHFPVKDAGFTAGDTEGVIVGTTQDGESIAGVDTVKIVGKCQ
ncbi:vWA domain-containing protein [Haladaptatus sp. NG-SE-30]